MSHDKAKQARLTQQIVALIQQDFTDLDEAQLFQVFAQVAQALREGASSSSVQPLQAERPSPAPASPERTGVVAAPTRSQPRDLSQPLRLQLSQHEGLYVLVIEALTAQAVASLRTQMQGTGGLWIKLPEALALNAEVDVCVLVPTGVEHWFEGRVVVHTSQGTAIDMKPVNHDYAVQWQIAQAELERNPQRAHEPQTPKQRSPRLGKRAQVARGPARSGLHHNPEARPSLEPAPPRRPSEELPPRPEPAKQDAPTTDQHAAPPRPEPQRPKSGAIPQSPPSSSVLNLLEDRSSLGSAAPPTLVGPVSFEGVRRMLAGRPPQTAWDLKVTPLTTALMEVAQLQGDGVLSIQEGQSATVILLQMGCPVEVCFRQEHPELSLGNLLVQAGKLTQEQHAQALKVAHEQRLDYDEALLRERLLSYQQVLAALQSRVLFLVARLAGMQEGRAECYPLPNLPRRFPTPPISLARVAFEERRKQLQLLSTAKLDALLEPFRTHFVSKVEPPPVPMSELQLGSREQKFYEMVLQQRQRVGTVNSITNLGRSETPAMLVALHELGFLRFEHSDDPHQTYKFQLDQIQERVRLLDGATHFEVLGVHWSSYKELVEQAYFQEKAAYQLDRFPEPIHGLIKDPLDAIQKALHAAYRALHDNQARATYRDQIVSEMQATNGIALYYRKGDMAMMRMDHREAEVCFKRVLELNPRHREAQAKLKALKPVDKLPPKSDKAD